MGRSERRMRKGKIGGEVKSILKEIEKKKKVWRGEEKQKTDIVLKNDRVKRYQKNRFGC